MKQYVASLIDSWNKDDACENEKAVHLNLLLAEIVDYVNAKKPSYRLLSELVACCWIGFHASDPESKADRTAQSLKPKDILILLNHLSNLSYLHPLSPEDATIRIETLISLSNAWISAVKSDARVTGGALWSLVWITMGLVLNSTKFEFVNQFDILSVVIEAIYAIEKFTLNITGNVRNIRETVVFCRVGLISSVTRIQYAFTANPVTEIQRQCDNICIELVRISFNLASDMSEFNSDREQSTFFVISALQALNIGLSVISNRFESRLPLGEILPMVSRLTDMLQHEPADVDSIEINYQIAKALSNQILEFAFMNPLLKDVWGNLLLAINSTSSGIRTTLLLRSLLLRMTVSKWRVMSTNCRSKMWLKLTAELRNCECISLNFKIYIAVEENIREFYKIASAFIFKEHRCNSDSMKFLLETCECCQI